MFYFNNLILQLNILTLSIYVLRKQFYNRQLVYNQFLQFYVDTIIVREPG